MLVKALETCFVDGHRRRAGDVFNFNGKAAYLVPVEGSEPVKVDNSMNDEQLRVRLAEYGVKTHPATGRAKLLKMLDTAEGR